MNWQINRIDFVNPEEGCYFCKQNNNQNRLLSSGTATILINDSGVEIFAGPSCAKKHSINPSAVVPNFTKSFGYLPNPTTKVEKPTNAGSKVGSQSKKDDYEELLTYLILRQQVFKKIEPELHKKVSYSELNEAYDAYKQGLDLNDKQIAFLRRLISNPKAPSLSYKNLQAVYTCIYWINQILQKEGNSEYTTFNFSFVKDLKKYLIQNLTLSEKQVLVINNILVQLIKTIQVLDHRWFERKIS